MQEEILKFKDFNLHYGISSKDSCRLVLIHGLCGNRSIWQEQEKAFKEKYELIIPDLLGHGHSSQVSAESATHSNVEVLASLLSSLPSNPTILVGHSWGGSIVNGLMKNDFVSGCIFVDSPCVYSVETEKKYREWGQEIMKQPDPSKFIKYDWFGSFLSEKCNEYIRNLVLDETGNFEPEWLSKFMEKFPSPERVETGMPILVAEGQQFFPENNSSSWMEFFPTAKRWEFQGKGHFYFLEEPASFNKQVFSFLSQF